jgi:hypothetical protein
VKNAQFDFAEAQVGPFQDVEQPLVPTRNTSVLTVFACRVQFHSHKRVKWSRFPPPETFPPGAADRSCRRTVTQGAEASRKSRRARRSARAIQAWGLFHSYCVTVPPIRTLPFISADRREFIRATTPGHVTAASLNPAS